MAQIEELDDTAQRLRVMWRKTNNFYASFASILFDTRKQFEAGAYPGWTFDSWLFQRAGLSESYVMQQLKVFSRVINAEAREEVERAVIKQAIEKRKAKQAALAERRVAAAERKVIAAHKKREQEQARAARQQLRLEKPPEPPAPAKSPKGSKAKERDRQRAAAARANARAQAEAGPENTVLRDGLAECRKIEATSRVELGRIYLRLKEEVDMHRAGKNPRNGSFWTWGEWASFYIGRSRQDIHKCITEFVASCDNSQSENVVSFPKVVGDGA